MRRAAAAMGVAVATLWLAGADCAGLLDDEEETDDSCAKACAAEATCEFRTEAECLAACPKDGATFDASVDACFAAAENCLESAACACDAGCARVDECSDAEADPECVSTCDTLIEQQTKQTYLEQRCRIESSCEDLAACSSVSG